MALQASFSFSSSSSSFSYAWKYDVFLSFRGTDTRYGFTGNLYKALCDKGIHTFIDDEELQRGEEITPSLIEAIQESRIAILVLSTNYASSSFCLDELVKIIECVKEKDRLVLPVFYNVDPSHVRRQRGSFGEAIVKHEERLKDDIDKVQKWKMALHQAANLSGYHFKHGEGYEHKFIGKIVEDISGKIRRVALHVANYPVGLESRVSKVTSLVDVGSNDRVHMVGIHGVGGIGKTTLALALYNLIADHFEGLCFLENVRENSNKYGLLHLQNILLSEVLGEKKINLVGDQQGISIIQHRLRRKKVLLILDDVDKQEQLQATAGKPDWFGPGSRVIVTTRDKHLLACHGVERTYEVEGLNKAEALELLSWKAFKTINVSPSYMDVSNRAVTYACGLPLALEVIGSNLSGKSVEDWESALERYDIIPNRKIQTILKVSFDALEEDEQSVFLDIACCFKGYELVEVLDILCAHHGSCMKYHIGVLVEKSLIKITWDSMVTLHDLIEDMGKEIVRQESPKDPGKRSRLWFHEDIVQVLEDDQGTGGIEIIHLDFPLSGTKEKLEVEWDGKAFKKMKNLKTLIVINTHFSVGSKHLPNALRVLEWWGYPSKYLPSNFHPKKLSILKLPNNCFTSLELPGLSKKFGNLKVLNFDESECLTHIHDVSGLLNLEELSLNGCQNLTTIHDSVGFLEKLKILSALSCSKLKSFPPIKLPSLEELHLSRCNSLESFPEVLGKMENLVALSLEETRIKDLPFSFRNLSRLQRLLLFDNEVRKIPSVILMMPELADVTILADHEEWLSPEREEFGEIVRSMGPSNVEDLRLACNLSDDFFPLGLAWFANVKELDLSSNNFTILPACIRECRFLRVLKVNQCQYLREIRGTPPNLEQFSAINCRSWTSSCTSMLLNQELYGARNTMFTLPGESIPEWFEHRSMRPSISFWFRNNFPGIAVCFAIRRRDAHHYLPIHPTVIINGYKGLLDCNREVVYYSVKIDHIFLFDLQKVEFKDNLNEVLLENEWNHVKVLCDSMSSVKESGIHVFKQKSNMEDIYIQFTNPRKRRKLGDGLNSPES